MDNLETRLANPKTREDALQQLRTSSFRTAAATAASYLDDKNKFVRLYALECLLDRGDRRYAGRVRPLLNDTYDMVRVTAIECLADWGCRQERWRIANRLDDRSRTVRAYAAWALGKLRATELRSRLLKRLLRERQDICRAGLLEALYILTRQTRFAEGIVEILETSRDHRARAFAANSLVGISDRKTHALVVAALKRALRHEKTAGIRRRLRDNLELALS